MAQGAESVWIATTPTTDYPALEGEVSVDVAVLGAGIVGVTTAVLLKRAGKTVALLDAKRIVRGASGYTTAKVTSGHGLLYGYLEERFGAEGARLYAESNQAALERVVELGGDGCDLERKPNYVYAETDEERARVEREVEAMRRAGLPASLVTETPLPYPIAAAARLEDQAQFHPRKYLLALAATIPGGGSHVFEETRALGVDEGEPCRVDTDRGELTASDVVVATQLPFLDRGLFFAKAHPHRSYAVAAPIQPGSAPDGMFINAGVPTRSVRTIRDGDRLLLQAGGEGHKPGLAGDEPERERYDRLEAFLREHWDVAPVEHRWSTQDYLSVDRVPFIGPLRRRSRHVYVATGMNKWGMTGGTVGAMLISDAILGRENPWAPLYASKRLKARAAGSKLVKQNAAAGLHFLGGYLGRAGRRSAEELARGEGALVRIKGRKRAVYRDEAGDTHVLSPVCRHLYCVVGWNAAERTWDCPCHGSRYSATGRAIQGPTVHDLKRIEP